MIYKPGGIAAWVVNRLRGGERNKPRLALLERIALGPRQSLALVEAEGSRILVATSADGSAAFHLLGRDAAAGPRNGGERAARISW